MSQVSQVSQAYLQPRAEVKKNFFFENPRGHLPPRVPHAWRCTKEDSSDFRTGGSTEDDELRELARHQGAARG